MPKRWLFLIVGIIAAPVFWLLGALLSGGGHNYAMMIVFFPWSMLLGFFFEGLSWWALELPVMAIQFPIYGLILGYAKERKVLPPVLIAMLVVHSLIAIWCFAIDPRSSWKLFTGTFWLPRILLATR